MQGAGLPNGTAVMAPSVLVDPQSSNKPKKKRTSKAGQTTKGDRTPSPVLTGTALEIHEGTLAVCISCRFSDYGQSVAVFISI